MSLSKVTTMPFDEPRTNKLYVQRMDAEAVLDGKVEEPENQREQWGGKFEFLLACLGNAVGLGNIWRFPYLAYKNGGGAFVIPYIIMVFLIGLPLFIVELSLGQYSALGPAHLYSNLAPILKGVGFASIVAAFIVSTYYNMILAWTLYYFVEAFRGQNWQHCNNIGGRANNTESCLTLSDSRNNITLNNSSSAAEEFFNIIMLNKSSGIEDIGTIQWPLFCCLLASWLVVCFALIKGIQSSGKVVYFTATFPYVILILLFIRGVTLPGAYDGIYFYVVPEWSKLSETQVWRDAAIQVFYSFGIAGGGMLTYASYNKFNEPILHHSFLIGFGDMFTSLFAGFVVFSMLGFMAHNLNKPIAEVVSGGFGLAFIAIPDGLSQMPGSVVWSVLYFFMLFLLGIDSQFAMIETVTTYIFDTFRGNGRVLNKPLIVSLTCLTMFLLGIPYCTNAGVYILELIDHYAAGFPYLCIALMETIIIGYTYGISRFLKDLNYMTGWKPGMWMRSHFVVMLATVCPLIISVLLLLDLKDLIVPETPFSSGTYVFPGWTNLVGWGAALIPIGLIPCMALHYLFFDNRHLTVWERLSLSLTPTDLFSLNARRNKKISAHGENNDCFVAGL